MEDKWELCYTQNWQNKLHPHGIDHPAKISYQLINKIYKHLHLPQGSRILDPFAGVSCTALHAMQCGYHWTGIEIEPKFVQLSQKNIDFWNQKYQSLPNWGSATILHGDSTIMNLNDSFDAMITSPPYEGMMKKENSDEWIRHDANVRRAERSKKPIHWSSPGRKRAIMGFYAGYGIEPNNLGNLTSHRFWEMMQRIIDNIYKHLKPNGYVVWVTKDLFRNRERIYVAEKIKEISQPQFNCIHHHQALLTEHYGTYLTLNGQEEPKSIKRISFFRYMVEKHYPENTIDWEDIICLQKI